MADPQFGQFAQFSGRRPEELARYWRHRLNVRPAPKVEHFQEETRRFEAAIAMTGALAPRFAIICGDMVNRAGDPGQVAEVKRIAAALPPEIPLRFVAGNHDACVDNEVPDHESLARYRADFGPDFYWFREDRAYFLVVNACLLHHPEEPDEDYPWGRSPPGRPPGYWAVPRVRRMPVVELFRQYGVQALFCGHWHRNHEARDGNMLQVLTGAVGYPLGDDPSGIRVVRLTGDGLE